MLTNDEYLESIEILMMSTDDPDLALNLKALRRSLDDPEWVPDNFDDRDFVIAGRRVMIQRTILESQARQLADLEPLVPMRMSAAEREQAVEWLAAAAAVAQELRR